MDGLRKIEGPMIPDSDFKPTWEPIRINKLALFDADMVKYITTYNVYKRYKETGEKRPIDYYIQPWLDTWMQKIGDPIIFCFSGKSSETFRASIAFEREYKGNRKGKVDPYDYPGKLDDMYACLDYIQQRYITLIFDDLEADDILSALQCENTYIISKDKDLVQVHGTHYDIAKHEVREITKAEAYKYLCLQILTGDISVDNIPGLPGIGAAKADKLLEGLKPIQMMHEVMHRYQAAFGLFNGTDMFVEMYNLVKLRENRGAYFREKYALMFETKKTILDAIKK